MFRFLAFLTLLIFSLSYGNDFSVRSPAFDYGKPIPSVYTCDGKDISPEIIWANPPANTKSFVLIMDDPDAPFGTFTHWVVYDIPASVNKLPENFPKKPVVDGIKQGINDFGRIGYGGPCPPPGKPHRYFIKLYATDLKSVDLPPKATKSQVLKAIQGHILSKAIYMGIYKRK